MNRSMFQSVIIVLGVLLICTAGCAHSIQVLEVSPQTAFRTLGMVSGRGDNESAAVMMALDQADPLGADAIIVVDRKIMGIQVILTCKAIQYLAPPPQVQ